MTKIEMAEQLREKGDFEMRSCWECNSAHSWMKERGGLRVCFNCGRWSLQGGYLDDEAHAKSEYLLDFPESQVMVLSIRPKQEAV